MENGVLINYPVKRLLNPNTMITMLTAILI